MTIERGGVDGSQRIFGRSSRSATFLVGAALLFISNAAALIFFGNKSLNKIPTDILKEKMLL